MPNQAVDWTVEQVLSGVKTLNARADSIRNTLRAARAAYTTTVRNVSIIPDEAMRARARAELTTWIHNQVALENRFQDFAAKFADAKARVKMWLQSVNITPPGYLGIAPAVVPVVVWGLVAAALLIAASLIKDAVTHGKKMDNIAGIVELARQQNWSPAQLKDALDKVNAADKSDITKMLEAAVPLAFIVAAVVFLGPLVRRRAA